MKKLGLCSILLVILTTMALAGTLAHAEYHHVADCTVCHYGLGGSSEASACGDSANLKMIRETIVTPESGTKPVVFTGAYVRGGAPYDGVCEVCHTNTAYHRNSALGDHTHYAGENCVSCHPHNLRVNPAASLKRLILDPVAVSGGFNEWNDSLEGGDKVSAVTSIGESIFPESNSQRQYFTFEDAPAEVSGDILSVRLWVRAKSYDNGSKIRRDLKIEYYDGSISYKQKIKTSDSYEYYYAEWDINPEWDENHEYRSAWEWADIDSWEGGVASGSPHAGVGGVKTGAEVGRIWLEVVYSPDSNGVHLTHGPVFGGVTDGQIKVWCRTSGVATVKVRYSKTEAIAKDTTGHTLGEDYGEQQADEAPSSSNDYTCVTTLTGLDADTRYYFTFIVDGLPNHTFESDSNYEYNSQDIWSGDTHPYWSSLPHCSTFPATSNTDGFSFVFGGDNHPVGLNHSLFYQMTQGGRDPKFLLDLGDHYGINNDVKEGIDDDVSGGGGETSPLWPAYRRRRGFSVWGRNLTYHILRKMPLFRTWSDHDYLGNNSHKYGDENDAKNRTYNAYDAFLDYTPLPTLGDGPGDKAAGDGDLVFTASGSDDNTVIQNPGDNGGLDFTAEGLYSGQVAHNVTTGAYGVMKEVVDSTTINTTTVSGGQFSAGDQIRIKRGGLWYRFRHGALTEFFFIDTRYKRDPNSDETRSLTPAGGDMLDGTRYGVDAKASGDALESIGANTITISVADWNNRISDPVAGDVVTNVTDTEYTLYTLIHPDYVYSVDGRQITLKSQIFEGAGEQWQIHEGEYTLIDSVDGRQITLKSQIFEGADEQWQIHESGGSDHRQAGDTDAQAKQRNQEAGHIQREWLIDAVNNSSATWKFIVSELTFLSDELTNNDKWADYDPVDAQRDYLKENIDVSNVIWLSADRHFAALNKDTDTDNPWPEALCGLFHCDDGDGAHNSSNGQLGKGSWSIDTTQAIWDASCKPAAILGAFGYVTVSSGAVTIKLYDLAGNTINPYDDCGVGVTDLTMTID